MQEVAVHRQGPSQEGGAQAPSTQAGIPVSLDEGHRPGAVPRGFSTPVRSARVHHPRPTAPQAGPMIRCNNCGTVGHFPKSCPNYGFYYPAPGKTRDDYLEDRQRVQDLFAADIIAEHEGHDDDEGTHLFAGARPGKERRDAALQLECPRCHQPPGERCVTTAGEFCEPHKARFDAVDSGPPGM